jgi:hypothetical protein
MLIPCLRALARFAEPALRLERSSPASMLWDEHGGTFVLRVDNLEVAEERVPESAAGLSLSISLTPGDALIRDLEDFAALHQLPLTPPSDQELTEAAVLAACHLPGKDLFIFAEEPALAARRDGETMELTVSGVFKARRVPCQETDLVIHLTRAAMARLVSFGLSLARAVC